MRTRLLIITYPLIFVGCALNSGVPTKTEYINTPSYCTIEMPKKPELLEGTNNFLDNFKKTLIYKDQLEMRLHCCRGDPECIIY